MRVEFMYNLLLLSTFDFGSALPRSSGLQDLPAPNDTFEDIRRQGKVYVDKSGYITRLLQSEDRFFAMCRPGRFGKTNFLQMLRAFFEGREELFAGLVISAGAHDWGTSHPVIYLDFSTMDCSDLAKFHQDLKRAILEVGRAFHIVLEDEGSPELVLEDEGSPELVLEDEESFEPFPEHYHHCQKLLHNLIYILAANGTRNESVVLLIDEYDWPLRSRYHRDYSQLYHVMSAFHRTKDFQYYFNDYLFRNLESVKQYIKLIFCTCTAKMHYVNREFPVELKDITFDSYFHTMIGLTSDELESDLRPHVSAMVGSTPNETFQTVVQQLRRRYNGYCFAPRKADTSPRMYNFHSVMSSLRDRNTDYLWHPSVEPKYSFMDDYSIDEMEYYSNLVSLESVLSTASIKVSRDTLLTSCSCYEKLNMQVMMIIRGYLTFSGYNETSQEYTVVFPNEEMRESYRRAVLKIIRGGPDLPSEDFTRLCENLTKRILCTGNSASDFIERLNTLVFERKDELRANDWLRKHPSDRIVTLMRACDVSLREHSPSGNAEHNGSLKVESVRREYKDDHHVTQFEQQYVGLRIRRSDRSSEYWLHFEFHRSAPCAMNVLLKAMSIRRMAADWPKERTLYLMGINFRTETDDIHEWIRITYTDGKFIDVQASHPNYLKMYAHIINSNTSSLVL